MHADEPLRPRSEYSITVSAVDSIGAISEPSAPLKCQTAHPPPTHGNVQAFLLASTDQSFDDLEAHYQQIGVVYPTYFQCGAGGDVDGSDDPLVTGWAEARKIAVMPRVNCQNPNDENRSSTNRRSGQKMIESSPHCARHTATRESRSTSRTPRHARPSANRSRLHHGARRKLHAQGDKLSTIVTAKYYNIHTGGRRCTTTRPCRRSPTTCSCWTGA